MAVRSAALSGVVCVSLRLSTWGGGSGSRWQRSRVWEEGKLAASLLYGDSSMAPSLPLQQGGDWLHPSILIST